MHSKTENIIVGSTGFVGQTLMGDISFHYAFNSRNIEDLEDCPDGCNLYLSCLPATKWKVNQNLVEDIENINNLISILKKKRYARVYLISTIDVYGDSPHGVDEDYSPNYSGLNYGSNRLMFESLVKNYLEYEKYYVFRLPALYGRGLKKNIIFDLMNNNQVEKINLNTKFQWYDMQDLSKDICEFTYHNPDAEVFNLYPEPVLTLDIVERFFPEKKCSGGIPFGYDFRTKYNETGYIYDKEVTLKKLARFLDNDASTR